MTVGHWVGVVAAEIPWQMTLLGRDDVAVGDLSMADYHVLNALSTATNHRMQISDLAGADRVGTRPMMASARATANSSMRALSAATTPATCVSTTANRLDGRCAHWSVLAVVVGPRIGSQQLLVNEGEYPPPRVVVRFLVFTESDEVRQRVQRSTIGVAVSGSGVRLDAVWNALPGQDFFEALAAAAPRLHVDVNHCFHLLAMKSAGSLAISRCCECVSELGDFVGV
jgi:hypothetical protein